MHFLKRTSALLAAVALAALAGCGTEGGEDAPQYQPVSGAGPFARLPEGASPEPLRAPFVLAGVQADLDDPDVVADGAALSVWVTVHHMGATFIGRADAPSIPEGFATLRPALMPGAAWEQGAVASPSIVADSPWLLFYAAAGAIGVATSADGESWSRGPGPALSADGGDEGTALGPPAAVRLGDVVRLYYPARGALWAAEAPWADLAAGRAATWTRLDGDPSTPGRDPMVASAPYAVGLGRACARARPTATGRLRHDLYLTAETSAADSTIGFAASYTGDLFQVTPQPILAPPTARSPAMTLYGDGALLLFIAANGSHDAVGAALSP
jgi:hypothetical protein